MSAIACPVEGGAIRRAVEAEDSISRAVENVAAATSYKYLFRYEGTDTVFHTMVAGLSTIDVIGLFGPFLVFAIALAVYYVWEGKRERQLREQYDGQNESETEADL